MAKVITLENRAQAAKEAVEKQLRELTAEGSREIKLDEVRKTNGVTMVAAFTAGKGARPMAYIDDILDELAGGKTDVLEATERVVRRVHDVEEIAKDQAIYQRPEEMVTKENVLAHVHRSLVNRDLNREAMKETPHEAFMDMEIMYRAIWHEPGMDDFSVLVTQVAMENLGITMEELREAADRNDAEGWYMLKPLGAFVNEELGIEDDSMFGATMLIATNRAMHFGAAAMTQIELFGRAAERARKDLYILPSSIHELVVFPADGVEAQTLKRMVMDINESQVDAQDILGCSVYKYSRETGTITREA